jgi:hypothetical protein
VVVILFNNIHEKAPTWICRIRAIFLQLSLSLSLSCWGDVTDPLLQCGQLSLIYWMPTNNFAMLCESEILFFVGPFVYANSFPLSLSSNVNDEINLKSTIGQSFFLLFNWPLRPPCRVGGQKNTLTGGFFTLVETDKKGARAHRNIHTHTRVLTRQTRPSVCADGCADTHTSNKYKCEGRRGRSRRWRMRLWAIADWLIAPRVLYITTV